jgi:predicted metal-dependent HD superfamily phosphohydrolase
MSAEKKRISNAEEILGTTLLAMVKINPTEKQVRALVMSRCLKQVPHDLVKADEIVDWIEFNIPAPKTGPPVAKDSPDPDPSRFEIMLDTSEREVGRCDYSMINYGRSRFVVDLVELAEGAATWRDLWESINGECDELVWEHNSVHDSDDQEYENYDSSETENGNWTMVEQAQTRERIRARLRERYPDIFHRLEERDNT